MPRNGPRRPRRFFARTLVLLFATLVLGGWWALPRAGDYLVVNDPLAHSDAIVVLAGAHVERWLEAVDLYREGLAPVIVLSPGLRDAPELMLRERGIPYPNEAELAREAMQHLEVPESAIRILSANPDNTAQEAAAVRRLADDLGWRRLIVVTSKYHTRRAAFAFRREFTGSGIEVLVHASRYDTFDPDGWWKRRRDARVVTSELQKLLAYRLGLGE